MKAFDCIIICVVFLLAFFVENLIEASISRLRTGTRDQNDNEISYKNYIPVPRALNIYSGFSDNDNDCDHDCDNDNDKCDSDQDCDQDCDHDCDNDHDNDKCDSDQDCDNDHDNDKCDSDQDCDNDHDNDKCDCDREVMFSRFRDNDCDCDNDHDTDDDDCDDDDNDNDADTLTNPPTNLPTNAPTIPLSLQTEAPIGGEDTTASPTAQRESSSANPSTASPNAKASAASPTANPSDSPSRAINEPPADICSQCQLIAADCYDSLGCALRDRDTLEWFGQAAACNNSTFCDDCFPPCASLGSVNDCEGCSSDFIQQCYDKIGCTFRDADTQVWFGLESVCNNNVVRNCELCYPLCAAQGSKEDFCESFCVEEASQCYTDTGCPFKNPITKRWGGELEDCNAFLGCDECFPSCFGRDI